MNFKQLPIISFLIAKRSRVIIAIIVLLVLLIGGYSIFGNKSSVQYTTAKVELGNLVQTVSETGMVKSAKEIELNFLNIGKVGNIMVKIGDKVVKDQILAELDYSDLLLKEKEASANLAVAQANLAKTVAGATSQEIAVSQANYDQARSSYYSALDELQKTTNSVTETLKQAQDNLFKLESDLPTDITTYEQAVTTAQTSLNNTRSTYQRAVDNSKNDSLLTIESKNTVAKTALDKINTVLNDDDAENLLSAKNPTYLNLTKDTYNSAILLLDPANNSLIKAQAGKATADINSATDNSLALLNKTFSALNYCYSVLENTLISTVFTQTDLDTHKTNISTQQTNISAGISAVQTAEHDLNDAILSYDTNTSSAEKALAKAQNDLDNAVWTAKNTLASAEFSKEQQIAAAQAKADNALKAMQVAKAQLDKVRAPARSQDITLYQAQVAQAQAALDLVKDNIENSIIKAPLDGTITKKNYEIGEQISAAKSMFSMLGVNNFEIELDVSEADIAKVKINDQVKITLDAFGEDVVFSGSVYFIEPAETVIQDVIYYKVKIAFDPQDQEIKSGMTANVTITTASKNNILLMPSRAVIEKNGSGKIVRLLINNKISEVPVTIGLRGDEGMVEVLSGVKQGDEVVTFIKQN